MYSKSQNNNIFALLLYHGEIFVCIDNQFFLLPLKHKIFFGSF